MPEKYEYRPVKNLLVDDKGFIVFVDPVKDDLQFIGSHLSAVYPKVLKFI